MRKHRFTSIAVLTVLCISSYTAVDAADLQAQKKMEKTEYPTRVFWGDTHLHTSNSFDVYLFGTPNSTPDTAYRFAKGLPVINPTNGTRWQIQSPLDFLVVADHAEMVGTIPRLFEEGDKELTETKTGQAMLELAPDKNPEQLQKVYDAINYVASGMDNELGVNATQMVNDMHGGKKRETTWERNIAAAEAHNEPGKFSALIGFEWSSNAGGANLHRVVFQAEDGDVARQYLPYSSLESDDPEDLWKWLDNTSQEVGATFVAIPHNPNISLGRMFPLTRNNGEPIDEGYIEKRAQWEPVVEATQIKGDSEAHPMLSPNDEFADFEIFDFALTPDGTRPEPTKSDYIRNGLMRGLEVEQEFGANPYKLGMIGSTDSHTGISAVVEGNFAGKGQHDARPEMRPHHTGIGSSKGWDMAAAGYAGVWATENTRQALVEAFKRKEVYATSGPRITLRFFGGYDFEEGDAKADLVSNGYGKGVPMGGDLFDAPEGKSPTFLIAALKDPNSGNLDRIQVIKGYLNASGESEERIYDVSVSDGRTIGKDGRCETPVGNTVNLKTGEYTNDIGDVELLAYWQDPDFDPSQRAFYYVRVLEIPTPRYSLLDSLALGIDWNETNRPATIQERAYSSPIWYTP